MYVITKLRNSCLITFLKNIEAATRSAEAVTGGVFVKKDVLKNFANFKGKHLCLETFFNKVAGLQPVNFLKRDSNTSDFL